MEKNFEKFKMSGVLGIVLSIILLILIGYGLFTTENPLFALLWPILLICWKGFTLIEPNEARVITFFGKYVGTIKENGFFWINPFYSKKRIILRARNLDIAPIKVNDKSGNPILIGSVVVWKVKDTYKAVFDIDSGSGGGYSVGKDGNISMALGTDRMKAFERFVDVQGNSAIRYVAGKYAYDEGDSREVNEITLRSGGEEINKILEEELSERLSISGIEIVEARINYLAYAPEIAAVMLRRQQADAIISAREKIVEGAVSMVKMALDKINKDSIVTLSEEKKAEIVSNLLVVLCSDESAQPVVNV